MKKTIYLMICLLTAVGVSAQSHTFRDTSYVPYWQFDFDAWVMEDLCALCFCKTGGNQKA